MLKNEGPEETESEVRITKLLCRRTGRHFSPVEHARCPYCFGTEADVTRGMHAGFCEYRRGVDPPSFGRPSGADRYTSG